MVDTRAQTKKMHDACFPHASMEDSNHQSTEPGAIIGSNDDLLTEILLRLPAPSILRFKSVSKHWLLLLSQIHFTQRYDNILKSPTGLIATDKYVPFDVENPSTPPFRCLDSYFDRPGVEVVQSCNGLLLCVTRPKGPNGASKYYVFNPTTKQLALIPPVPRDRSAIWFMSLAFHQTDCVRYKVMCVLSVGPHVDSYQIQVYSSDTKEWKISIESFSASISFICHGVYWNGAVYWASVFDNRNYWYFKIDDQQLHTLPLPLGLIPSKVVTEYLGESRGHLHLIAYNKFQGGMVRVNVYEMLSDHSGWFVKYQLQLDAITRYGPGYVLQVVDVVRGKEEEDTFLVLETLDKIITYNVHDRSFKQICSLTKYCSSSFYRYTETLSSF
ncbi:putative F-box domain-containing protein [Helianthus annuus]|nr:putative F-box domain-containing protein [Helianthus annuus]KAJ0642370.1 putative F-box domain-containing protein [Helianthus annuus]